MESRGHRNQFTFYKSYVVAIRTVKPKALRAQLYEAVIVYALDGIEPDLESFPPNVFAIFELIRPTLDSGRRKALGAMHGAALRKLSRKEEAELDELAERRRMLAGSCQDESREIELEYE